MNPEIFFKELWKQYTDKAPSALKIKSLFEGLGNTVFNDHIAIRTFDDPRTNIDVLSKPFLEMGYKAMGEYNFEAKKLYAVHFEHISNPDAPKIFISQLLTEQFSTSLQEIVRYIIDTCDQTVLASSDLILKGKIWDTLSYEIYEQLESESEYAAWMYVNGFCSNHFTVDVNKLEKFDTLPEVNEFLKSNGFVMNPSGGEIKGSPDEYLEQSSILADIIPVHFEEGVKEITSCYYEFSYRYAKADGNLFNGFIASSADKIFESTNMELQAY